MDGGPIQKILDAINPANGNLGMVAVVAAIVIVLLFIVWKMLSGRKREQPMPAVDLKIDVMQLGTHGPPAGGPILEFYNVPVRLAAIIVAPAGRVRPLPDQLDDVFDAVLPGLDQIVAAHQPLIRRWPPQLSPTGFAHMFFQHVRLPGDGGKGSPWSAAAGLLKIEGQPVMAGLILRTESTSSHGQVIIDKEEKWLSILRVKT